jgi:hypothetical protein
MPPGHATLQVPALSTHTSRHRHPPPPHSPAAEAIEAARRLERLAEISGGGNRVTLSSLASIDEDGDQQVQQRLSLILKVSLYQN